MNKPRTRIVIHESFLLYFIPKIVTWLEEAEASCFMKNASASCSSKSQMLPSSLPLPASSFKVLPLPQKFNRFQLPHPYPWLKSTPSLGLSVLPMNLVFEVLITQMETIQIDCFYSMDWINKSSTSVKTIGGWNTSVFKLSNKQGPVFLYPIRRHPFYL